MEQQLRARGNFAEDSAAKGGEPNPLRTSQSKENGSSALKKETPAPNTAKKPLKKAVTEPLAEDSGIEKPQTEKKKKKVKYDEPAGGDESGSDA